MACSLGDVRVEFEWKERENGQPESGAEQTCRNSGFIQRINDEKILD